MSANHPSGHRFVSILDRPATLFGRAALALAMLCATTTALQAHPHEFITMHVGAAFDDAGRLAGFRYHWTFDEFFSAYALEGQDANGNGTFEQDEIDALHAEILGNIKEIDYFTTFDKEHVVGTFATAVPISAGIVADQLSIVFDLALAEPLDLTGRSIRFAIYDGSFYTAMNFQVDGDAVTLTNAPKGCSTDLEIPEPEEDIMAFANSLSQSESGGDDLGRAFAETVIIKC